MKKMTLVATLFVIATLIAPAAFAQSSGSFNFAKLPFQGTDRGIPQQTPAETPLQRGEGKRCGGTQPEDFQIDQRHQHAFHTFTERKRDRDGKKFDGSDCNCVNGNPCEVIQYA